MRNKAFTLIELLACQPKPRAKSRRRRQARSAFTLIELLVVVAIVLLLAALLLPGLKGARGAARKASCLSNLHQLALAYQMYSGDNTEQFPPFGATGFLGYSTLGPYFGKNRKVLKCPSDPHRTTDLSYMANEALIESPLSGNACQPTTPPERPVRYADVRNPSKVVLLREFHPATPVTFSCGTAHLLDAWFHCLGFNYPAAPVTAEEVGYSAYSKAHLSGSNMSFVDGSARWYKSLPLGSAPGFNIGLYDISTDPNY